MEINMQEPNNAAKENYFTMSNVRHTQKRIICYDIRKKFHSENIATRMPPKKIKNIQILSVRIDGF